MCKLIKVQYEMIFMLRTIDLSCIIVCNDQQQILMVLSKPNSGTVENIIYSRHNF